MQSCARENAGNPRDMGDSRELSAPRCGNAALRRGAAHRHVVEPQRRLADADGHALAFLAAHADARVEPHVVADHAHVLERFRAAADQRRALDRIRDLAVLDHVCLGRREHELAVRDVDLAAAEVHRVQAVLDRFDDLPRVLVAVEHVGVGHPRHRQRRVRFAPRVAGDGHLHQPRVQRVLDVALQDAVLDERRALRRVALVVDVQRSAAVRQRAVVDDGHALGRDLLADAARERRRALAVEVALEPVADRLVQQHAGPARAEHDRHRARGRRARVEVDERGVHRVVDVAREHVVGEVAVVEAAAAAARADLAPAVVLGDHRHRHAHERADVRRERAVAARDEHDVVFAGEPRHHLLDARVAAARHLLDALEQLHLRGRVERGERIGGQIQVAPRDALQRRRRADLLLAAARGRDRLRRDGRLADRLGRQVVRVRERGALAGDRAHADALVDAEAARLDDAFLEAPRFAAGGLEVQIRVVDAMREDIGERAREKGFVEAVRREQDVLREREVAGALKEVPLGDAGFDDVHADSGILKF
ncbi:hypothetical protein BURPS1710b_3335 [Burkholderia pseudomallei 1710b]|uniref:Uncharacterized protein n=1 Tax=Burkholderia pseudomallei (strain 1710b) TaxID=320372 RepID=Q3JNZ8_BURP1|nr:hypothetical protein BURPS1710b_3335 [Burkholderia pseudomallei 1710b]